jgi:ABC-type phosphate transport system auxiliary subunit
MREHHANILQIERRRAERKRAAQLHSLTPEQRKEQLANELDDAMAQAKAAKTSGDKGHKRVAGEVIKQLKQEIASNGFKEADIHQLIAANGTAKAAKEFTAGAGMPVL